MIFGLVTGELGRGATTQTPLALDLTDHAVTLFARQGGNEWTPIASVPVDAPDFLEQLGELRTEALVRDETGGPVTIWLPPEQVLVRDYTLDSQGSDARHEARSKLSSETPYTPSELMVALSPIRAGQPTKVLGALGQTVMEARDYAEKWGFTPGPVSTRVAAEAFDKAPPVFRAPEPAPLRLARRAALAGLAACSAGALLMGIYGVSQVFEPLVIAKVEQAETVPVFAALRPDDQLPLLPSSLLRPAGSRAIQSLAIQPAVTGQTPHRPELMANQEAPIHLAGTPILPVPKTRPDLKVGSAPALPERTRPDRLGIAATLPPKRPVSIMRQAIDTVRAKGRMLARVTEARGADPEPSVVEEAKSGSLVAAVLPNARRLTVPQTVPTQPDEEGTAETGTEAEDLTPTALAPVEVLETPKPRPIALADQSADPIEPAKPEATASLVTQPAETTPSPDTTEAATDEVEDETPTKLAALTAPTPLVRPKSIEAQPVRKQASKAVTRDSAPRSVRTAAVRNGLHLGETNLIGVLQGSKGRQALVRLRDGGYLKVSRGDVVDGWRVRSIGRETLRLSRRGQNRTLMLVSR